MFPLLYAGVALNCKAIGLDVEAGFAPEPEDGLREIHAGV